MYIRHVQNGKAGEFILRESYQEGGRLYHRDLLNLGPDPCDWVEYPGGNAYMLDPRVEEALERAGAEYSTEELEAAFLPFFEPETRRIIEQFGTNGGGRSWRLARLTEQEIADCRSALHMFDRRRLHYLRCGRIDMGELGGSRLKYLNRIVGMSRDEIEHTLESMERQLRPHEVRSYLYASLNLQAWFPGSLLKNHPAALDPEKLDGYFLEELCNLNSDASFFQGLPHVDPGSLHPFLTRYVPLYFDHEFGTGQWAEYLHERMRRAPARPPADTGMAVSRACLLLGMSVERYKKMSRKDLVAVFRRKAKEAHPDQGGEHDGFVQLKAAYESLLAGRVWE